MKKIALFLLTATAINFGLTTPSNAEGDQKKGERAFGQCKACHTVVAGETKRTGPNLFGILGRQAASTDFDYSKSLLEAGEVGLVWTEENLDAFLVDPRKFLAEYKGTSTGQVRTKKTIKVAQSARRADLIAYLSTLTD